MGFFKKKRDVIPELPKLPKSQEYSNDEGLDNQEEYSDYGYYDNPSKEKVRSKSEEPFSLPQIPSSKFGDKINQNTIKEEVSRTKKEIPHAPKRTKRIDDEELSYSISDEEDSYDEPVVPKKQEKVVSSYPKPKNSEPLFIQLDKFEETVDLFEEIKSKIKEMDSLIGSITEVKSKEEKTLNDWSKEIEKIKLKLEKIDKEIFNKV